MSSSQRVLIGLGAVNTPPQRAVVTVGVFDGVHRAHQRLIYATITTARRYRGTSVVVTFDPDPQSVLDPVRAQPILMPLEVRVRRLLDLGIDWVWIIPFTKRFARTTAERFIRTILIDRLRATALIVGSSFVFGRSREGNLDLLKTLGSSLGMQVLPVRQMRAAAAPISSSRIRQLLAGGRLASAAQLLGRPPALYGVVVRGAGRGRRLGFPTANVQLCSHALPPVGVYTVTVRTMDWPVRRWHPASAFHEPVVMRASQPSSSTIWNGVMNIGVRPTFGQGPLVCEVHLLKFVGTLLGRAVEVSLLHHLRRERCFPNPEALRRQLHRDVERARQLV